MRERDAKCILQKLYCTKFKKLNKDHESTKYIPMPRKLRIRRDTKQLARWIWDLRP